MNAVIRTTATVTIVIFVVLLTALAFNRKITPSNTNPPNDETSLAPDLASGTWLNSEPLTIKSLRGRVVIVDFWTFGCYNCRNTLPYLKQWDSTYRDKGL